MSFITAFYTLTKGSWNETRRLTRDMGYNLRVIPKNTDMTSFYKTNHPDVKMPESYVSEIAKHKGISYAHLTAVLYKNYPIENKNFVLTGIAPDLDYVSGKKSSMIFKIKSGKVYIGHEVARISGLNEKDNISIFGRNFIIEKVLSETGSLSDVQIFLNLKELQILTNSENEISEIMALNCLCKTKGLDPLKYLRNQLSQMLPDAKVVMNKTIADARERQRKMVEKYFSYLLPFILLACSLWMAVLFIMNVQSRKQEIGILKAIGHKPYKIFLLFIIKAVITGLAGAILGFILGSWFAVTSGNEIFIVTFKAVKPLYTIFYSGLLIMPIFATVSVIVPAFHASRQQPADTLKNI